MDTNNPPSRDQADGMPELNYEGHPIGCRGEMLNLTSMWNARERPANREPPQWLRLPDTKRLLSQFVREQRQAARDLEPGLSRFDNPDLGLSQVGNQESDPVKGLSPNGNPISVERGGNDRGATWAHKHLALAYAAYLSPAFHLWVLRVAFAHLEMYGGPETGPALPMGVIFTQQMSRLAQQVDEVDMKLERLGESLYEKLYSGFHRSDRNTVDIMFLIGSIKEILMGPRRPFSETSKQIICDVVREKYHGGCPCCVMDFVLADDGTVMPGAEFDHHAGNQFNRPEMGWLICKSCHYDLNHGGYLRRLARRNETIAFQDAVLLHRRLLRKAK